MSLDTVDDAFVRRLAARARPAARPASARAPAAEPRKRFAPAVVTPAAGNRSAGTPSVRDQSVAAESVGASSIPSSAVEEPSVATPAIITPAIATPAIVEPLVARLLARAPEQWDALAGHVEAARQRGRRVIAVAGGCAGEGRTTLLHCLAARLRSRGRDVACAGPHDLAVVADGADGRGPTHDKRIILLDAGIWFPPGPIRRSLLQVASLGCEAAILVRRSGASGGFARQAALEALGIEVLGEVLTFTSPADADDAHEGDAAA
ncbi:MAG: hypothetical protein ACKOSQ_09720 [Planctomycetaceae bacterium]